MKTNLGASGYKKRNKFTGDSLEGTTLTFFKNVREIILKKIKIKKKVKAYVTIYLKNCLRNWQYRFIKKGMWKARIFGKKVKLYALNNFSYNSHSKGLRTKKKRRV